MHLMRPPDSARHLVVRNSDVVRSPSSSVHTGTGTGPHVVWGMTGQSKAATDVNPVAVAGLR